MAAQRSRAWIVDGVEQACDLGAAPKACVEYALTQE